MPATSYPAGLAALHTSLRRAVADNLAPPPKLSLSEWAQRYAVLSRETSAQTGRFHAYAYQPGIMDAITDPTVEEVDVMKSARVGFTKILDHAVGYFIHQDPSPILVVQPRVEDAEDYSKTEIAPMVRDTPVLAALAGDEKAKDGNRTIRKQVFKNGASITYTGANAPGGFRRITCRLILLDEVDGYPVQGAGDEGDQVKLAIKRGETFWNRKAVLGSTPTLKSVSRIEKAFKAGDQRFFFVPCPHCGERQVLEWGGKDKPYGIKWRQDGNGAHLPETAHYVCRHNGCIIDEAEKGDMVAQGEWRATAPFRGKASFHIWAGYSPHPNASWGKLVAEWLEVYNDPLGRQTFVNLVLGEPFEDRGMQTMDEHALAARTEVYGAEVPSGVAVITFGGDTQDDRVELEFVGWGKNEESWSLDHVVIEGDPDTEEFWERVDSATKRIYYRADGRPFAAQAGCIDSGGHHTQRVYDFAKARLGRKIWAIKGESARNGQRSPVWPTKRPSARHKSTFRPVIVGVNAAKDVVRTRLLIKPPENVHEAKPGYCHFPADRDVNYFAQLLAERSTLKSVGGRKFRVWEQLPGRANEALDCRVYAYAALCGLQHFGLQLNRWVESVAAPFTGAAAQTPELAPAPASTPDKGEHPPGRRVVRATAPPPEGARKKFGLAGRLAGA
ncbi:phage terminase large subunit family protein [Acidocella sp.]|uniref:phage terminase large subunit family protein n=1 Tax=Acidocella sp. TaxID=50710 RepID=UPI002601E834|nr:phage terminase large subunit family protein [Acidocella sp.]